MPSVKVVWHHGRHCPQAVLELGTPPWEMGVLFVGERGMLIADYKRLQLLPEKTFAGFEPPPSTIPASLGCHRKEWFEACKGHGRTLCPFDYGAALTETILLGNIAYRTGKALEWDSAAMRFPGCPAADRYVRRDYRRGWEL